MKLIHRIEDTGDRLLQDVVSGAKPFVSWAVLIAMTALAVILVKTSVDEIVRLFGG